MGDLQPMAGFSQAAGLLSPGNGRIQVFRMMPDFVIVLLLMVVNLLLLSCSIIATFDWRIFG